MVRSSPPMPGSFRSNPGTPPGGQLPPPPYPAPPFYGGGSVVTSVGTAQLQQQQQQQQHVYRQQQQQVLSPLPPPQMVAAPFPVHQHGHGNNVCTFMPFVHAAPPLQTQPAPSTPPTFPMPYAHASARSPPLRPAPGGGPVLAALPPPASALQTAFSFGMGSALQQQPPHNCGATSDSSQRGFRVATPSGDSEGSGRGQRAVPSKRNSQLKSRGDLNKSNARAYHQHQHQHHQANNASHDENSRGDDVSNSKEGATHAAGAGRPSDARAQPATAASSPPDATPADTSCDASSASSRLPVQSLDEHRIAQRQKQVRFGKVTCGYKQYRYMVPTFHRQIGNGHHPETPRPHAPCSKRKWDAQVSEWRRALHAWDAVSTIAGAYELQIAGLPTRLQKGLEREVALEDYLCATQLELRQMHDEVTAMGNLSENDAGACFGGAGGASERAPEPSQQPPQRCTAQLLRSAEFGSVMACSGSGRGVGGGGGSSPHALTSSDCASSPKLVSRLRTGNGALPPSATDGHSAEVTTPPVLELPPSGEQPSVVLSSEISTTDVSVVSASPQAGTTACADDGTNTHSETWANPPPAEYEFSVIGEWSTIAPVRKPTSVEHSAGHSVLASPIKRRSAQVSESDDTDGPASVANAAVPAREPPATVVRLASPPSAGSPPSSASLSVIRKTPTDATGGSVRRQVGSRCAQYHGHTVTLSPIADVLLQHDTSAAAGSGGGGGGALSNIAAVLAASPQAAMLTTGSVVRRMVVVIYVDGSSGTVTAASTVLTPLRGSSASKRLQLASAAVPPSFVSSGGEQLGGSPPTTLAASASSTTAASACACGAVGGTHRTSPSIPAATTPAFERGRELFSIDPRHPDEVLKALRGAFNLEKLTFIDPPSALSWRDQPVTSSMLFAPTVTERPLCTIEDVARWTECSTSSSSGSSQSSDASLPPSPQSPLLLLYRGSPPVASGIAAASSTRAPSFDAMEDSHNVPSPETTLGISYNPSPQTPSRTRQLSLSSAATVTAAMAHRHRENSLVSNASMAVQHQQSFCGTSSSASGVAASLLPGAVSTPQPHPYGGVGGVAANASFANEEIIGALTFCTGHAISASPLTQLSSAKLLNFGLACDPSACESAGGQMNLDPTPTAIAVGESSRCAPQVDNETSARGQHQS